MANTVQTDEMRAANIPPLETEALRRAAEGCASGDADECEACPFRPTSDCGGELIRALLRLISNMERERKTLLYSASTGLDLCVICEHNDRLELRACDVDERLICNGGYPACESCPCHDCTGFDHFSADMSEGSADE